MEWESVLYICLHARSVFYRAWLHGLDISLYHKVDFFILFMKRFFVSNCHYCYPHCNVVHTHL